MFNKKCENFIRPAIQNIINSKNFNTLESTNGYYNYWILKHNTENVYIKFLHRESYDLYINDKRIILSDHETNLLCDMIKNTVKLIQEKESHLAYEELEKMNIE